MEIRKIQETRSGTFFVTLPKDWAQKNGISRGSLISTSVTPSGRLVIDPRYNLEQTPQTVIVKASSHLSREIIMRYLLGFDIIRIEAKDRITIEQREIVKSASSRLIGLEIIEEDQSKIVLQCLLEPSALVPEKILRREHLITLGMYRDAVMALIDGDIQLAKSVIARDNESDRLYFLLVRILRTIIQNPSLSDKLGILPIDCLDYRLTASLVESVGDQSSQIADYTIRLEGSRMTEEISHPIFVMQKVVYECYDDALNAFLSRNITIADLVRDRRGSVEESYLKIKSASKILSMEVAQNLFSIVSLISLIYDHCVDISDLTTSRNI